MTNQSNSPVEIQLEAGKTYYWCACGKSTGHPFCDGSHKDTDVEPLAFTAEETKTARLCSCKKTATPPFCDGSHTNLNPLT